MWNPSTMTKPVLLVTKRSQKISEQTKRLRRGLFKAARKAVEQQSDDIRGFALVTWDQRGFPTIAVSATESGPVSLYLVPTFVQSQLQRYVNADDRTYGIETQGLVE